MTHRKPTVSALVLLLAAAALAGLAGARLAGTQAQRDGLARGPGRAQLLAVDGEHDPPGITDVHAHRAGEGPGLRASADHEGLDEEPAVRLGELDPAVLDRGEADHHVRVHGRRGRR